MSALPVLIVGAGPTGLVLAIELTRRGVVCHLIDRLAAPLGRDRAVVIKARSMEVLDGMGLAERFLEVGRVIAAIDLFAGAQHVACLELGGLDSPYAFDLCIAEGQAESLLTERLEQLGGRVERGVELIGLEQGALGVRARLRSQGGERSVETSWVVGTDGIHSAVRKAVGDRYEGHAYPHRWGVLDARIRGWQRPQDHATTQIVPPILIAFPLRDGRFRFTFRPGSEHDLLGTVAAGLDLMSPGATLHDPDTPQLFQVHARVAQRYRTGRVLLAGDAAHAATPFQGHGMNTGIQDADNLGWKLALVETRAGPATLIDSYEAERRPIAQAIARSGDEAEARNATPDSTAIRELASGLATAEGRRLAAIAESEIGFGYEHSPIIDAVVPTARTATGTQVGYRVGDAAIEGRGVASLHGLLNAQHVLLVMLGEADRAALDRGQSLVRAAARYQPHVQSYLVTRNAPPCALPDGLLRDPDGKLHARFGAEEPCLCLVRPDGHLGLRAEPPSLEVLDTHLRRLLLQR